MEQSFQVAHEHSDTSIEDEDKPQKKAKLMDIACARDLEMTSLHAGESSSKASAHNTGEYMPKCRPKEGVCTLEDGEEFYKQCLKFPLSLKLTPQQVHDLGRREVYRIRQQMEEVVGKTGYQGEFREFLHHLRTNQEYVFDSKEELLDSYRDI